MHGWLDNCGSFDRLLPYFPKTKRVICIDIPGHGLSSHYPPGIHRLFFMVIVYNIYNIMLLIFNIFYPFSILGMLYNHFDGLSYIRRIADFYSLKEFSLLGKFSLTLLIYIYIYI